MKIIFEEEKCMCISPTVLLFVFTVNLMTVLRIQILLATYKSFQDFYDDRHCRWLQSLQRESLKQLTFLTSTSIAITYKAFNIRGNLGMAFEKLLLDVFLGTFYALMLGYFQKAYQNNLHQMQAFTCTTTFRKTIRKMAKGCISLDLSNENFYLIV